MVEVHCVRDKGSDASPWLIGSDWVIGYRGISICLVHSVCQPLHRMGGKLPSSRACHLFDAMVGAHSVRDNGSNANKWLGESDHLRVIG